MLVLFGKLYIIEPTKRWSDKDESNNIFSDETSFVIPSGLENPSIPTLSPPPLGSPRSCCAVGIAQ